VTHHPPIVAPKQDEHLTFTFVTDGVESAVAQAKTAAGRAGLLARSLSILAPGPGSSVRGGEPPALTYRFAGGSTTPNSYR
jgi:hypothetical protein